MFHVLSDLEKHASAGHIVFVRGDLNVPMTDGVITDTTRLERLAPTLQFLSKMGLKIGVLSHFGRPKGEKVANLSLRPVADGLARVLDMPVSFVDDCIGDMVHHAFNTAQNGAIFVLENTRFYAGEEANDIHFAQQMADIADYFVNDAFSVSHRAHASTHALATLRPAFAGFNMQAELDALSSALDNPARPVMAIVGGSKVSSKLDVLLHLVKRVDILVIGGGMANTFLHAQGTHIGASLCETDLADTARNILDTARQNDCEIILPTDACVSDHITHGNKARHKPITHIAPTDMILDIGPQSTATIVEKIGTCKTLIWNGPLGAFEFSPFETSTMVVCDAVVARTQSGDVISVGGGGDTVSALAMAGAKDKVTYVSTAGGAFLEWMEGKTLPGVEILRK